MTWNGPLKLLRNESPRRRSFTVRLERANGEVGGIGARVRLRSGGRWQVRDVVSGTSYLSHSSLAAEFGLGETGTVEALEVVWPGGTREQFTPPRPGSRSVRLIEGSGP